MKTETNHFELLRSDHYLTVWIGSKTTSQTDLVSVGFIDKGCANNRNCCFSKPLLSKKNTVTLQTNNVLNAHIFGSADNLATISILIRDLVLVFEYSQLLQHTHTHIHVKGRTHGIILIEILWIWLNFKDVCSSVNSVKSN